MFKDTQNKNNDIYAKVSIWLEEYHSTEDKYKKTKSKALIVTNMLPIIKKIARTIARRSYDPIDDMVQAGAIGLLKAIDNYTSDINNNFKIYAGSLIIGEMKHYLRDKMNTIRVPRHIQELSYRINTFTSSLTIEELNNLTNDDVAYALNVRKNDVDFVYQVDRRRTVLSLDGMVNNSNDSMNYEDFIPTNNYEDYIDNEDTKIVLKEVIEKLPNEYKELVKLYYYQDLSQKEIAEKNNLTQMQVSRKMKKAFAILYKMIADNKKEN